MPVPKVKHVETVSFHDANIYHNFVTGRSVTRSLHFLNKTPLDWCSKKEATVETDTCVFENSSTRTSVKKILDLRITLRYVRVPIRSLSCIFGDGKSAVDRSMTRNGKIHK